MKVYRLEREQVLGISVSEAWAFFSDPRNLREITPPSLGLTLTSDPPDRMHPGMVITYRLHPLFGVQLGWVTEISHVEEPTMFVDEQRFGPYRFWHHLHRFEAVDGGVRVTDTVHYGLPFGVVGRLAHRPLVRRKLDQIFDYRARVLASRFGGPGHRENEDV